MDNPIAPDADRPAFFHLATVRRFVILSNDSWLDDIVSKCAKFAALDFQPRSIGQLQR